MASRTKLWIWALVVSVLLFAVLLPNAGHSSFAVALPDEDEENIPLQAEVKPVIETKKEENQGEKIENVDKSPKEAFDEEEFVGLESLEKKSKQKLIQEININQEEKKFPVPVQRDNYYLEIGFTAFIIIYVANFFVGKSQNQKIALQWGNSINKVLSLHFSKVIGVHKESYYTYRLKGLGRINCLGLQATVSLRKRHDLFSLIMEMFFPVQDQVKITVLMKDETEPFVFSILRKKNEKKARKDLPDLSWTSTLENVDLPDSLCCLAEVDDLKDLLTREVVDTLKKHEKEFISLHFSDQAVVSARYPQTLEFTFLLPATDPDKLLLLTKMALYLTDQVANFKLSKFGIQKTEKNRRKLLEAKLKEVNQARQEEAQKQKLEKEKKEFEKLSPAEKKRLEEKLEKKELKKRQQKMKVVLT